MSHWHQQTITMDIMVQIKMLFCCCSVAWTYKAPKDTFFSISSKFVFKKITLLNISPKSSLRDFSDIFFYSSINQLHKCWLLPRYKCHYCIIVDILLVQLLLWFLGLIHGTDCQLYSRSIYYSFLCFILWTPHTRLF